MTIEYIIEMKAAPNKVLSNGKKPTFGEWLRFVRRCIGRKQLEFAAVLGVVPSVVSRYERNGLEPDNVNLAKSKIVNHYDLEIRAWNLEVPDSFTSTEAKKIKRPKGFVEIED